MIVVSDKFDKSPSSYSERFGIDILAPKEGVGGVPCAFWQVLHLNEIVDSRYCTEWPSVTCLFDIMLRIGQHLGRI